jgi:hypothetical protein
MMETRIHSTAAKTSTLLDDSQLASGATGIPEDTAVDEKVDFAATLQVLISSSSHGKSPTNSSGSSSTDSSPDDPTPRIAILASLIPSSMRTANKTWISAISSDTIRNTTPSPYWSPRSLEAFRAYQLATNSAKSLDVTKKSAANEEPEDQGISSSSAADSLNEAGISAVSHRVNLEAPLTIITRDLAATADSHLKLPLDSSIGSQHLRSNNSINTSSIGSANNYDDAITPLTETFRNSAAWPKVTDKAVVDSASVDRPANSARSSSSPVTSDLQTISDDRVQPTITPSVSTQLTSGRAAAARPIDHAGSYEELLPPSTGPIVNRTFSQPQRAITSISSGSNTPGQSGLGSPAERPLQPSLPPVVSVKSREIAAAVGAAALDAGNAKMRGATSRQQLDRAEARPSQDSAFPTSAPLLAARLAGKVTNAKSPSLEPARVSSSSTDPIVNSFDSMVSLQHKDDEHPAHVAVEPSILQKPVNHTSVNVMTAGVDAKDATAQEFLRDPDRVSDLGVAIKAPTTASTRTTPESSLALSKQSFSRKPATSVHVDGHSSAFSTTPGSSGQVLNQVGEPAERISMPSDGHDVPVESTGRTSTMTAGPRSLRASRAELNKAQKSPEQHRGQSHSPAAISTSAASLSPRSSLGPTALLPDRGSANVVASVVNAKQATQSATANTPVPGNSIATAQVSLANDATPTRRENEGVMNRTLAPVMSYVAKHADAESNTIGDLVQSKDVKVGQLSGSRTVSPAADRHPESTRVTDSKDDMVSVVSTSEGSDRSRPVATLSPDSPADGFARESAVQLQSEVLDPIVFPPASRSDDLHIPRTSSDPSSAKKSTRIFNSSANTAKDTGEPAIEAHVGTIGDEHPLTAVSPKESPVSSAQSFSAKSSVDDATRPSDLGNGIESPALNTAGPINDRGRFTVEATITDAPTPHPIVLSATPKQQFNLTEESSSDISKSSARSHISDPGTKFPSVSDAYEVSGEKAGTEFTLVRLVQDAGPIVEPGRVASMKVELANGEIANATVRERAGSIDVKIVTPTSASAQRVSGEIDTLRQSLDAAGMKLGQAEVSYQQGSNRGRGGNEHQPFSQRDKSNTDGEVFTLSEVSE